MATRPAAHPSPQILLAFTSGKLNFHRMLHPLAVEAGIAFGDLVVGTPFEVAEVQLAEAVAVRESGVHAALRPRDEVGVG